MNLYCKNCGSEIEINSRQKIAVCDFCGMEQTVPKADDPKKLELFIKANDFRMSSRFDLAKSMYENIISAYPDDNEAYWCKILCEYGIEYVDDIATESKIPTCHRTVRESIFNNRDYKFIIKRATKEEKAIYEAEAKEIDRIQKEIIESADREAPYDIFICYKESDENGKRTRDSQIATRIYTNLTNKGYKVFFARVTLKELAGSKYEPVIYSALTSAKVMLVVTTTKEFVNAPWVRNEWSRFLEFMQNDYSKVLVPCICMMDAYDLPDELSEFQVLGTMDMDFTENLTRQIDSKFGRTSVVQSTPDDVVTSIRSAVNYTQPTPQPSPSDSLQPLLRRIEIFLLDEEWGKADEYAEKVLDMNPECAEAYLGKLLAELKLTSKDMLKKYTSPFDGNKNFKKAVRFANSELKRFLESASNSINENIENEKKQSAYEKALKVMQRAKTESEFMEACGMFDSLGGFSDSKALVKQCKAKIDELKKDATYREAEILINQDALEYYENAEKLYSSLGDWKDSKEKAELCKSMISDIKSQQEAERNDGIYEKAKLLYKEKDIASCEKAIELYESILGWKDSKTQIRNCRKKIEKLEADRIAAEAKAEEERLARLREDVERARIEEICKKLLDEYLASKSEAEISTMKSNYKRDIEKQTFRLTQLARAMDAIPEYTQKIAEAEKRRDEYRSKIPVLHEEKSHLSIFAIKRKKEIDEEIRKTEDHMYVLTGIKSDFEQKLKTESLGCKTVEDVNNEILRVKQQIKHIQERMNDCDQLRSKELILAELRSYPIGKEMYNKHLENEKFNESIKDIVNAKKGSTVKFGKYFNKTKTTKEDIEWQVLAREGDKVLLISKYALDCVPYNEIYTDVTWEICSLREWLNTEFLNSAFSEREIECIPTVDVEAHKNYMYPSYFPGRTTQDKVFVLSIPEINKYLVTAARSACSPTPYAKRKGAFTGTGGRCCWWVRSPGYGKTQAPNVNDKGEIYTSGYNVNSDDSAVRPALWIKA